jgi:hypothetical protein
VQIAGLEARYNKGEVEHGEFKTDQQHIDERHFFCSDVGWIARLRVCCSFILISNVRETVPWFAQGTNQTLHAHIAFSSPTAGLCKSRHSQSRLKSCRFFASPLSPRRKQAHNSHRNMANPAPHINAQPLAELIERLHERGSIP